MVQPLFAITREVQRRLQKQSIAQTKVPGGEPAKNRAEDGTKATLPGRCRDVRISL
jgi:hypothetical protein